MKRFTSLEARIDAAAHGVLDRLPARGLYGGLVEFLVFGMKQAWACLFGGAMLLDSPEDRKYRLFTLGAQVDLGFTVVMRLPMVLSLGIAQGFGDKDIDGRTELMASLKIL